MPPVTRSAAVAGKNTTRLGSPFTASKKLILSEPSPPSTQRRAGPRAAKSPRTNGANRKTSKKPTKKAGTTAASKRTTDVVELTELSTPRRRNLRSSTSPEYHPATIVDLNRSPISPSNSRPPYSPCPQNVQLDERFHDFDTMTSAVHEHFFEMMKLVDQAVSRWTASKFPDHYLIGATRGYREKLLDLEFSLGVYECDVLSKVESLATPE